MILVAHSSCSVGTKKLTLLELYWTRLWKGCLPSSDVAKISLIVVVSPELDAMIVASNPKRLSTQIDLKFVRVAFCSIKWFLMTPPML